MVIDKANANLEIRKHDKKQILPSIKKIDSMRIN